MACAQRETSEIPSSCQKSLLSAPQGALIGWVHFLCFDLFTGRWAYLDAIDKKIPALLMAPVLFFIFMLGPVGLLLHLLLRFVLHTLRHGRAADREAVLADHN